MPRRHRDSEKSSLLSVDTGVDYGSLYSRSTGYEDDPDYHVELGREASVVPSEPITLSWDSLSVWKQIGKPCRKKQAKQILNNVSGIVEPGQLVALMGASGAGKTTLLNMLTFRNQQGFEIEGQVCVNHVKATRRIITSYSAYVQQDDEFIGTMTVREHLVFNSFLRLPSSYSRKQKLRRVNEVIRDLGLTKCRNTKIGVAGVIKGISGGEAKRLAFASSVLTNPSILFCDEPTSGLDSFMAESIVEVLQSLAARNKTIICTIHQPASEVYTMFDRLILLAEGRTAYFGPAPGALDFFGSIGYECPLSFNPADFFIQTLAIAPGQVEQCKETVNLICNKFEESKYILEMGRAIENAEISASQLDLKDHDDLEKKSPYKAYWVVEVMLLLWRNVINSYRNKTLVLFRLITKIILGLFVGLLYIDSKNDQKGIMNINGALFFSLNEIAFPAIFGVINLLPVEFPVTVREHHDGMYRMTSFYLAKILSYLATFVLDGVIYITITYFMVGFRASASAFFIAMGIVILVEQTSVAFGTMVSAISPSQPVTIAITGPIMTLITLTGGLYANAGTIPVYLSWFQYVSWFRYGFELLSVNQWHYVDSIACTSTSLNASSSLANAACIQTGDQVLKTLSFNPVYFARDLGAMTALLFGFHFIAFVAFSRRVALAR